MIEADYRFQPKQSEKTRANVRIETRIVQGYVELISSGHTFTEGPIVIQNTLYFSDVKTNIHNKNGYRLGGIYRIPLTKPFKTEVFIKNSGVLGGVEFVTTRRGKESFRQFKELGSNGLAYWKGNLVMCQHGGQRVVMCPLQDCTNGNVEVIAYKSDYDGKKLNSPNDISISGNMLYFSDPWFGMSTQSKPGYKLSNNVIYGVYSVDLNSRPYRAKLIWGSKSEAPNGVEAYDVNGISWIVIGTSRGKLKFLKKRGYEWFEEKNRETKVPGYCDGVTVSKFIFAACGKTVHIFDHEGNHRGKITSNSKIANTAVDNGYLYLTAEQNVFRVRLTEYIWENEEEINLELM
jgi:sugar lactone lactonase YvrE